MAWNASGSLGEFSTPFEGSPSLAPDHQNAYSTQSAPHDVIAGPSQLALAQREGESDSEYCYRASSRNSSIYGVDDGSGFIPRRLSIIQHAYASSSEHSTHSPTFSSPPSSSSFSTFPLPSPIFLPRSQIPSSSTDRMTQVHETWSETFHDDQTGPKLAGGQSGGATTGKSWFTAMQDSFLQHQATAPLSQLPPRPHSENRQTPAFDYRSPIHDSSPRTSPQQPLITSSYSTGLPAAVGATFERSMSSNSELVSPLRRSSIASFADPSPGLRERKSLRLSIQVPAL